MSETFILIPGRTSRQGTGISEGKFTDGYVRETTQLHVLQLSERMPLTRLKFFPDGKGLTPLQQTFKARDDKALICLRNHFSPSPM